MSNQVVKYPGRHKERIKIKQMEGKGTDRFLILDIPFYSILTIFFCLAKSCGDLDAPLDGDVRCTSFVDTKYCSVSCRDNKVVFNATGNWGARTWYCLGNDPVWKPTSKVPDCVGE